MARNKEQATSKKGKTKETIVKVIRLVKDQLQETAKPYSFYDSYHDNGYIDFHDKRKNISLKDKGRAIYTLANDIDKEIVCYAIDGKLISDTTVDKCDFGLYTEDDLLILIELKGSDYGKAIDQLQSTINILVKTPNVKVSRICGRVVLNKTRVPDTLETKEKKFKLYLKQNYNGTLEKCTAKMENILSTI